MAEDWIGKAKVKPGALHRQLHVDKTKPIPTKVLNQIQKAPLGTQVKGASVTPLLKRRVNFALDMRKR
jgi:hypothetical protein